MAAKIVLTIGKRKLTLTPQEAKEALQQLSDILTPPAPKETFAQRWEKMQDLELERLRKENREARRDRTPQWPNPHPYAPVPIWYGTPEITCRASQS